MKQEQLYEQLRSHGYNVASNYRQRAKNIIEFLLTYLKAIIGQKRWRQPSEETIEQLIDELPGVLNWCLKNYGKQYSNLPLTEEQMTEIEQNIANKKITTIETKDFIFITLETTEEKSAGEGGA